MRKTTLPLAGMLLCALLVPAAAQDMLTAPPGGDYQKVSDLVPLPEFVPGLGILYVQPATLPAGPFLGYDRDGKLVNTVYMVPVEDLEAQKEFALQATAAPVDHVDLTFNAGHPGVEAPHYHIVLWHVGADEAEAIEQAQ